LVRKKSKCWWLPKKVVLTYSTPVKKQKFCCEKWCKKCKNFGVKNIPLRTALFHGPLSTRICWSRGSQFKRFLICTHAELLWVLIATTQPNMKHFRFTKWNLTSWWTTHSDRVQRAVCTSKVQLHSQLNLHYLFFYKKTRFSKKKNCSYTATRHFVFHKSHFFPSRNVSKYLFIEFWFFLPKGWSGQCLACITNFIFSPEKKNYLFIKLYLLLFKDVEDLHT